MQVLSKGFVPKNTKNTVLRGRCETSMRARNTARNTAFPDDPVTSDIFTTTDSATLNKWLSMFAVNGQGKCYTPSTIYCAYIREMDRPTPLPQYTIIPNTDWTVKKHADPDCLISDA